MLDIKSCIIRKALLLFIMVTSYFGLSGFAMAVITCNEPSSHTLTTDTVVLSGSYYVGEDLPVGSVIYRTSIQSNGAVAAIECDAAFSVPKYHGVETEPSGPSFPSPSSEYIGNIYPTNVPGIGVALWTAGKTFTKDSPLYVGDQSMGSAGSSSSYMLFDISLIKTGPVATGSSVNGSSISTVNLFFGSKPDYVGLPITGYRVNFSGSINFITQTCLVSDYDVNMGTYDSQRDFSGVGSTTPWIDASIPLSNCPNFTGFHDNAHQQSVIGSGTPAGTSVKDNMFEVTLAPLTSADGATGVIDVDTSSGSPATGVGIQLGYSETIGANPATPANVWKPGRTWNITAPNSPGSSLLRIPLSARYYQKDMNVTPGTANGKVMFTISYK